MAKIQNKFVIFGAIAAAALAVPGLLGPLMFQEAEAARDQRNTAIQNAAGLVALNANVQANVDVSKNAVAVCVITEDCEAATR